MELPTKQEKKSWEEIVARDEFREFVPEEFVNEIKELNKERDDFKKKLNEMAEIEIRLGVKTQNIFLKLREYFAKNGHEGVWNKDISFDKDAMKEGHYVVNIMEDNK